jgi:hypothetical protein
MIMAKYLLHAIPRINATKFGSKWLREVATNGYVVEHIAAAEGDRKGECAGRDMQELAAELITFSEALPSEAHDTAREVTDAAGDYGRAINFLVGKHGNIAVRAQWKRLLALNERAGLVTS